MKKLLLLTATVSLGACSTIVSGTTQPFTVKTQEVSGAACSLVDSKNATWNISSTPETREITKGDGPLKVTCSKPGYKTSSIIVEESFAGATLGNVILGGGIGVIVDAASGAAQEYPDEVTLWLEPDSFASMVERNAWLSRKAEFEAEKKQETQQQQKNLNDQESYN